jgi:hypothetical protein
MAGIAINPGLRLRLDGRVSSGFTKGNRELPRSSTVWDANPFANRILRQNADQFTQELLTSPPGDPFDQPDAPPRDLHPAPLLGASGSSGGGCAPGSVMDSSRPGIAIDSPVPDWGRAGGHPSSALGRVVHSSSHFGSQNRWFMPVLRRGFSRARSASRRGSKPPNCQPDFFFDTVFDSKPSPFEAGGSRVSLATMRDPCRAGPPEPGEAGKAYGRHRRRLPVAGTVGKSKMR